MKKNDISTTKLSLFLKINFFITTLFFLPFLIFNENTKTLYFTIPTLISTSATLYLIYFIMFRPLFFLKKITVPILITVFTLTNFALLLDFFIYRIWKFHINGMVLNILTSPSAFDSIQTGKTPIILGIGYFIIFIFIEIKLLSFLKQKEDDITIKWNKIFNRIVAPIVLVIAISEKFYYGFANMYANEEILESTKPIPLYQPLTFTRFMEKHFGLKAAKKQNVNTGIKKDAKLNYPFKPIKIAHPKPINIFIFAADAVRNDILNKNVAPNIINFSKNALWFANNRSGGDATRFGIFTLFYGLNAPYWFAFLNAKKGPVFFKTLKKLNYDIAIFSSTSTSWPEFRKTTYFDIQDKIYDKFLGKPWQKDKELTNKWLKWIDEANLSKPIFSFVFLDSTHASSYPKQFAKFKPDNDDVINYATINKDDREYLLNQYKNSIFYADSLIGKMVKKLKSKGLYKNSIIVFTSDHGQEFFEFGYFGHNSSFDIEQTNSPLMVKIPGVTPKKINYLTSSIDLIPTLLKKIGVTNKLSDFSNGKDLLDKNYHRDYAVCGKWYKDAIITPKYTLVFSKLSFKTKVLDTKTYKPIAYPKDPKLNQYILEVLNQNRKFIK